MRAVFFAPYLNEDINLPARHFGTMLLTLVPGVRAIYRILYRVIQWSIDRRQDSVLAFGMHAHSFIQTSHSQIAF